MSKKVLLAAIAVTLLGSAAVLAQGQPQGPQHPMTFFVAKGTGTGNLGGIAGADSDVAGHELRIGGDNVDRAKIAAVLSNGIHDAGKHAYPVRVGKPDREAVADRWSE